MESAIAICNGSPDISTRLLQPCLAAGDYLLGRRIYKLYHGQALRISFTNTAGLTAAWQGVKAEFWPDLLLNSASATPLHVITIPHACLKKTSGFFVLCQCSQQTIVLRQINGYCSNRYFKIFLHVHNESSYCDYWAVNSHSGKTS